MESFPRIHPFERLYEPIRYCSSTPSQRFHFNLFRVCHSGIGGRIDAADDMSDSERVQREGERKRVREREIASESAKLRSFAKKDK